MYNAELLQVQSSTENATKGGNSVAPRHAPSPLVNWCLSMLLVLFIGGVLVATPVGIGGMVCVLLIWISLQVERLIGHVMRQAQEMNDRLLALLTQNDKMKE